MLSEHLCSALVRCHIPFSMFGSASSTLSFALSMSRCISENFFHVKLFSSLSSWDIFILFITTTFFIYARRVSYVAAASTFLHWMLFQLFPATSLTSRMFLHILLHFAPCFTFTSCLYLPLCVSVPFYVTPFCETLYGFITGRRGHTAIGFAVCGQ